MSKLAPTRVRSRAYDVWRGGHRDYTATCRLCGDSCTFAGNNAKQDWRDALAWCHGHLAVWHPAWRQEICPHKWKAWKTDNTWTCILCKAKGGTRH